KTFRSENWVNELITGSVKRAEQYDQGEQWIRSLRLYSDLGVIEPSVPLWKDRLKLATRRVRLLAIYTPDMLKTLQEHEMKDREEVEQLLHPTTQPATQPSKKDDADKLNDSFKVDWHDTLKGVRMDMLWEALV